MISARDAEQHARAGTLAAALLSEPVGMLETLGMLVDDRLVLLAELWSRPVRPPRTKKTR